MFQTLGDGFVPLVIPLVGRLHGTCWILLIFLYRFLLPATKLTGDKRTRECCIFQTTELGLIVPSDLCAELLLISLKVAHMCSRAEPVPVRMKKALGQIILSVAPVGSRWLQFWLENGALCIYWLNRHSLDCSWVLENIQFCCMQCKILQKLTSRQELPTPTPHTYF